MTEANEKTLTEVGFTAEQIKSQRYLNLRYTGTDTSIMVEQPSKDDTEGKSVETAYAEAFYKQHQLMFGFNFDARAIIIDNVRVRSAGHKQTIHADEIEKAGPGETPSAIETVQIYFEGGGGAQSLESPVFDLEALKSGMKIEGPAIILNKTSTILVEPESHAVIDDFGNVEIDLHDKLAAQDLKGYRSIEEVPLDPIELSIFGHRFMSIAEQMGITLQQTSASTNIKERLDFSCALFDPFGNLVANAPHVPVHLGSMQDAVKFQVQNLGSDWREGEVILTNHPTAGGTHLPDMTVITPVYEAGQPVFYVASRGHHADIGGIQPGSMPAFSKVIEEEGAAFVSFKIVKDGQFNEEELTALLCNQSKDMNPLIEGTRNLKDNLSDFRAQIAANTRGILLVHNLIEDYSLVYVQAYMLFI